MALQALNSSLSYPLHQQPFSPSSPLYSDQESDEPELQHLEAWTKRKRSKRPRLETPPPPPTEEEYLALCLVMLARGGGRANNASPQPLARRLPEPESAPAPTSKHVYKCSVCNKAFGSYQALGGHKASHRKLISQDQQKEDSVTGDRTKSTASKIHQCSVCHKFFSSGQALGGHKRCHWEGTAGGVSATPTAASDGNSSAVSSTVTSHKEPLRFDLNLPALPESWICRVDGGRRGFFPGEDEVESPLPLKDRSILPTC